MSELFEMAGLCQNRTNLPFYIWLSPKAGNQHDVRLKVTPGFKYQPENEVIVGLRPTIHVEHGTMSNKDWKPLAAWIDLNLETILAFWNEEIDQDDMLAAIKPLR